VKDRFHVVLDVGLCPGEVDMEAKVRFLLTGGAGPQRLGE
jgi:hypothetical protein